MSGRGGRGRGRGRRGYTPPTGAQLFLRRSLDECGLASTHSVRTVQDITRPRLFPDMILHSSGDQNMLLVEQQQQQAQQQAAAAQAGVGGQEGAVKSEGGAPGAGTTSTTTVPKPKAVHSVPRPAQTIALISKSREIHHRIQNSVYYVRPTKDVPDVVRYSDAARRQRCDDASAVLSNCLGGRKRTRAGLFVPEELGAGQRRGGPGGAGAGAAGGLGGVGDAIAAGRAVNLKDLEEREAGKRARAGSVGGPPGGGAVVAGRERSASNAAEGGGGIEEDYLEEEAEEEEGEDYVMNYYESEGEEDGDGDGEPTF